MVRGTPGTSTWDPCSGYGPIGKKDLGDGRSMWEFEAYPQEVDHGAAERLAHKPAANGKTGADEDGAGANDKIPF
jgi:hypothetical protein